MRVRDAMSSVVWSCRADDTAQAAARLMWDHDVGAVPVIGAQGELVGIVTDRDLCMLAYFTGRMLAVLPVEEAMSHRVFTVRPDEPVAAAEQVMRSNQVRRLPVLEGGRVVGMLSLGDVARAEALRPGRPEAFACVVGEIARPREHIGNLAAAAPERREERAAEALRAGDGAG
jgi:CBS domain-containing protein